MNVRKIRDRLSKFNKFMEDHEGEILIIMMTAFACAATAKVTSDVVRARLDAGSDIVSNRWVSEDILDLDRRDGGGYRLHFLKEGEKAGNQTTIRRGWPDPKPGIWSWFVKASTKTRAKEMSHGNSQ